MSKNPPAGPDDPLASSDTPSSLPLTTAELAARLDGFAREFLAGKSPETVGTYRRALHEFERHVAAQRGRFRLDADAVETYKRRSMEKLGLDSRAEIVRYAIDRGWLD